MAKFDLFIARFPYGGMEYKKGTNWLIKTVLDMKRDKTVGEIYHQDYDDTPISMTRNKACVDARAAGADYILMIDSDVHPDYEAAKPFWSSSWDFIKKHRGPAVIAAPYGGPPPSENVYVFRWRTQQSDHPDVDFSLQQFTREEAFERTGIEQVAALPTGLMLFHTEALTRLPPPWFEYEWTDETRSAKASTEDVYFTRNASLAGIPVYCNWDSWAGHRKPKTVGKPRLLSPADVRDTFRKTTLRQPDGVLIDVPKGGLRA